MESKSPWMRFIKEINLNWLPQSISFNTDMTRHYYELQLRDLEALTAGSQFHRQRGSQYRRHPHLRR